MCFVSVNFTISGRAMANPNDGDDHAKLVELQGLLQRAQEVEQSLQQQIVRPAAKAKVASRNPADYARSDYGDYGFEMVGNDGGAMSDASKRLHDVVDDVVADSVTQVDDANPMPQAVPKMNTFRIPLEAVNSEAFITTASAPKQHSGMQTMMGVKAASAGVPQQPMALAAALDRANPSISLPEAQRLYPSIPLDGTAPAAPATGDKGRGKGKRIVLVEDQERGLPVYTRTEVPAGPVRELWHIQHPINDAVPFPEGVESLEQWSMTTITMQKYSGITFGQLLGKIIAGDREAVQYSSWLVHSYSRQISRQPRSQAPDLSAFLLRSGFDPDERASSISYVRSYGSYREA